MLPQSPQVSRFANTRTEQLATTVPTIATSANRQNRLVQRQPSLNRCLRPRDRASSCLMAVAMIIWVDGILSFLPYTKPDAKRRKVRR